MKDIEIVLQGSIDNLLDKIFKAEDYDCINIFKNSDTSELQFDYFDFSILTEIMTDLENSWNAVYVPVHLSKEQENKYLTLFNILGEDELIKIIYEEYKDNPTLEY